MRIRLPRCGIAGPTPPGPVIAPRDEAQHCDRARLMTPAPARIDHGRPRKPPASAAAGRDALLHDAAALVRANINPVSLLATDYLNHFNEAVMLIELIPDMPDMLDDAKRWTPKDYKQHFHDSNFAARDLVCEAYDRSPDRFRIPFDLAVRTINRRLLQAVADIAAMLPRGHTEQLDALVVSRCAKLKHLIAVAGSIVNGSEAHVRSAAEPEPVVEESETTLSQDDIDALFK